MQPNTYGYSDPQKKQAFLPVDPDMISFAYCIQQVKLLAMQHGIRVRSMNDMVRLERILINSVKNN